MSDVTKRLYWITCVCNKGIEDSRLTHDVEFDGVAGGVALDVGGDAGVVSRAAPPHPLQHEAPARQDHAPPVVGPNHHVLK